MRRGVGILGTHDGTHRLASQDSISVLWLVILKL